ncbi:MAG: hypothetical protein Q8P27_01805, partial [Candidatus Peregrinibacteria bacterium]|nr:hypothetical protein [Candidatus Peregrinibacteria bacterium]
MKTTITTLVFSFILLQVSILPGCASDISEVSDTVGTSNSPNVSQWQDYTDPGGRFKLFYPPDWIQTESLRETQFWEPFEDGINSVKVALFEESRFSFEAIQTEFKEEWQQEIDR